MSMQGDIRHGVHPIVPDTIAMDLQAHLKRMRENRQTVTGGEAARLDRAITGIEGLLARRMARPNGVKR